jgi:hypothetical protein
MNRHVNFIITANKFSEKKIRDIASMPPLVSVMRLRL